MKGALGEELSRRVQLRLDTPVGRLVAAGNVGLLREVTGPRGDGKWVTDAI